MNPIIVLSHFHKKIGPSAFYIYPKDLLSNDMTTVLTSLMDQPLSGFFIHAFENFTSLNYPFEIQSIRARGGKEMLMVSVILDQSTSPENEQKISKLLQEFSKSLGSHEQIYIAFYRDELNSFDEKEKDEIKDNYSLVKLWVKELYWAVLESTRERTEEERIAVLLNKKHIYDTLHELSEGVLTLEELKEWFIKRFPDNNFDEMITTLLNEQLVFINQIGRVEKYIILLKEVVIERIPPDSVIEFFDDIPELIDILLSKVQKYFNQYETKTEEELEEDVKILYQIMADPKTYNLISKLREGLIQRDILPQLVSKKTLDNLIETVEFLKKRDVIEELAYNNERYIVLKSNIQITTAFPEYLRKRSLIE
ncbi:MAG: hypothetical protein ACFFHV_19875 [Promethearchaeota archaeon]